MEEKTSTKGMVLDICSMRSFARSLLKTENNFNPLLDYLTAKDYYNDENLDIPETNAVCKELGIGYRVYKRQVKEIHDNLRALTEKQPFTIKQSEYHLYIRGYNNSISIKLKNLKHIPKVGEHFDIPFFKEFLGGNQYFVSDITHEFIDEVHCVAISLSRGFHNAYWELRKDQAMALGEIQTLEELTMDEFDLIKHLDLKPWQAW